MTKTEVVEGGEPDANCISISVTTVTGSITGETMLLKVDSSSSIHQFKLFVQKEMHASPEIECGNPRMKTIKEVTPDFQRVFFDGGELTDDQRTLQQCGVKKDSELSFAVRKNVGNKLRGAMRRLGEDFSHRDDCDILGAVLKDLKERFVKGGRGSTDLIDELFDIFDPNFEEMPGVHDGYLTLNKAEGDYIQWAVDEETEGAFPFKTYYGIPAYTSPYHRKHQHVIGQPHPGSLVVRLTGTDFVEGATGYFSPNGQSMACTAHFARQAGTAVYKNATDTQPVGHTTLSAPKDDFAVIAMTVACQTTGQISTNVPVVGETVTRPATYQTGVIGAAVIEKVNKKKFVAREPMPALSKQGDSNSPWSTPGGRTIGIHSAGDPGDGTMSVLRLTKSRVAVLQPRRRSKRLAFDADGAQSAQLKKQKTGETG